MALCPGLPRWAGTRRNAHTPTIPIIIQSLSASSIHHDPQHPPCSNYVLGNLFAQPLSMSSLVYLLVWSPPPHILLISSPNQHPLFTTHKMSIKSCKKPRYYTNLDCRLNLTCRTLQQFTHTHEHTRAVYVCTTHAHAHTHTCTCSARVCYTSIHTHTTHATNCKQTSSSLIPNTVSCDLSRHNPILKIFERNS